MGYLKKILLVAAISTSLFAIDNFNDIKIHSYGKNNISVGLMPVYAADKEYNENGDIISEDIGSGVGFSIHSKASLKQYHYKHSEFYWNGGIKYNVIRAVNQVKEEYEEQRIDAFIGLGYTINTFDTLLYSLNTGVGIHHITRNDVDSNTFTLPYLFAEASIGIDTYSFDTGVIFKTSAYKAKELLYDNIDTELVTEQKVRVPLQFNSGPKHSFIITPEVNLINSDSYTEVNGLITLTFSWIYI